MTQGLAFDRAAAERLVAVYVTPDVVAQREQILQALALRQGDHVLDVGTGPGLLAAAIAERVGAAGRVVGVDISAAQLAIARANCASFSCVELVAASATALPFADATFDIVVVTQVLEYVAEVAGALAELARVLRPGGRIFILDTDWDSLVWHTEHPARMRRVLAAWDEHLADPYLPRTLAPALRAAGLDVEIQQVIPLFNPVFDPQTYSDRMIDLIAAFVAGRRDVTGEEAAAWAAELRALGAAGRYFFSLNRYLFGARKPSSLTPGST